MEEKIVMGISVIISVVVFFAMNLACWFIYKDTKECKYLGRLEKTMSYLIISVILLIDLGGVTILAIQALKGLGVL